MSRSPQLVVVCFVAIVAVAGIWLWQGPGAGPDAEAVLAEVDRALAAPDPGAQDWSHLVAQLEQLAGEGERVAVAKARIELVRGRPERAAEHLRTVLQGSVALPVLRLAREIWRRRLATVGKNPSDRAAVAREAQGYAERAAAEGKTADDEFLAWQAAVRAGDSAAAKVHAEALRAFPESLPARTVAWIEAAEQGQQPAGDLDALLAEWPQPPVELELWRAIRALVQQDYRAAVREASALSEAAPQLVDVRNWAAAAYQALALSLPPVDPDRVQHLRVRDAHLDWLDKYAPTADPRRVRWLEMRQQR